jgi:hypothetical protein
LRGVDVVMKPGNMLRAEKAIGPLTPKAGEGQYETFAEAC